MAAIPVQRIGNNGAEITFAAANAGGDTVAAGTNAGGWKLPVILLIQNGHTAAQTVTVEGLPAVSVPATTGRAAIPVHRNAFGSAVPVTYSGVTALTVAAVAVVPAVL